MKRNGQDFSARWLFYRTTKLSSSGFSYLLKVELGNSVCIWSSFDYFVSLLMVHLITYGCNLGQGFFFEKDVWIYAVRKMLLGNAA